MEKDRKFEVSRNCSEMRAFKVGVAGGGVTARFKNPFHVLTKPFFQATAGAGFPRAKIRSATENPPSGLCFPCLDLWGCVPWESGPGLDTCTSTWRNREREAGRSPSSVICPRFGRSSGCLPPMEVHLARHMQITSG